MNIAETVRYAFPIFLFLIALEYFWYRRTERKFPFAEAAISLLMAIVYQFANKRLQGMLAPLQNFIFEHRLFDIPTNTVWAWVLGFFGVEFAYYWLHRCAHEIRWMWASHSVHHSPVTMTFSGAYRLGLTGVFSGLFLFFLPLMFLGFSPKMVAILFAINLVYQFFLHTESIGKLGVLELFLNTPSHHRVHHAINEAYIDKNYGGVLIIFDRMFGTLAVEDDQEEIKYGLLGKVPSLNPLKLFFQEWVAIFQDLGRARSWRDAWYYAFGRPGWQPEKSRVTSQLDNNGSVPQAEILQAGPLTMGHEKIYASDTHYRR